MMTTTIKALMTHVSPPGAPVDKNKKISVIGAGTVGSTIAFTLLAQKLTTELVLIDKDESLARGEMLDLQNACIYLENPLVTASADYEASVHSKLCIITAGMDGGCPAETKEETVTRNVEIFKGIIPDVVKHSPDCILIIVTNPVDIMTYVAWKLSGFGPHRVIGIGTILESKKFKQLLSHRLGVSQRNLQAYIIGEQGDNGIPVWSGVGVSGVNLREINTQLGTKTDPEDWQEVSKQVIEMANEVNSLKGCSSWGVSMSISRIVKAILYDTKECFPISTHIKGCRHGVDKDVFISLPCILGNCGVVFIVRQNLNDEEKEMIQKSADCMYDIQKNLKL